MQSDEQSLQAARAAAASQQEQFRALARHADAAHEATRAELRAAQARLGSSETALMHARVRWCAYTPTPIPTCVFNIQPTALISGKMCLITDK